MEESGWLDYIISFVATARLLVELLRDDNSQNMIILSGDLEVFWAPVILILSTIIAKKQYRTIRGLLELMRYYLPSFGLPLASCMNFEGSQIEAKAPVQEQHYRLITQRAGHVPVIPLLIDCISLFSALLTACVWLWRRLFNASFGYYLFQSLRRLSL